MYDLAIIGGGPGGYVAAIKGAQAGAKVVLVEEDQLGGVCLNRGCIPTKTLLHAAELLREIKSAAQYGIEVGEPVVNFQKLMERKDTVVKGLVKGVDWLMQSNQVEVVKGRGDLLTPNSIAVNDRVIEAKNIIIAVGSQPASLPVPGADGPRVITSDAALSLESLPASIAIIGGGAIGLEMAILFRSLGCETTIIEMLDRLAPNLDEDLSKALADVMRRQRVKVITGARVEAIQDGSLTYRQQETVNTINAELVMMATGRRSNGLSLALDKVGIKHQKGVIETDQRLRTNLANIYAIGDVNGRLMLAHVAMAEAMVAVANIMGEDRVMSYEAIPQCIYTIPEVAAVGLTEAEAVNAGYQVKTSRFPLTANGRAMALGQAQGFIKLVADAASGRILGMHLMAPHATELITQGTLMVDAKLPLAELERVVFPHPTISEAIAEAHSGDWPPPLAYLN